MGVSKTQVVKYIRKGDTGAKGDKGATLRGPQAWSDCATGYAFKSGGDGEEWKDVVLYNGNYYSCVKSHTKTASNYPGSTIATSNGYWQLGDKIELVATKILLATYALVENLGVTAIDMKDSAGNILFQAKDGNVTCNSGTFSNITVKGDSTLEGIVKAQMYYSPTKQITTASNQQYTIDPQTEPCCSFLINEPTNIRRVTLPKAADYDGLEIKIFTKQSNWSTSNWSVIKALSTDNFYIKLGNIYNVMNGTTINATVEDYNTGYSNIKGYEACMIPNMMHIFKSMNGAWYALQGLYTGE